MTLVLPSLLTRRIDGALRELMTPPGMAFDFRNPEGEAALMAPDSVSWRIFKNPVSVFIGGAAAVILELAEPRVRSGVWDFTSFKRDPMRRMQRTGLAAMATIYGARSKAEAMIAGVVQAHDRITGKTDEGVSYRANDVELLDWVQATASFGFLEAYHRFVRPLSQAERDAAFAEARPAARLYGAVSAPGSEAELEKLFESMKPKLRASPIVFEYLDILKRAPVLPAMLRPMQRMFVRAAVEITPGWAREVVGLGPSHGLRGGEAMLLRQMGRISDRIVLGSHPAVQACLRLGLRRDHLFR
jgi:uncharacterized protein (DUF2236 family)